MHLSHFEVKNAGAIIQKQPGQMPTPTRSYGIRIQRMVKLLEGMGFIQQSKIPRQQPQRSFLEVFPAPALVMLFPCHLHAAP
jgi:predicted RNase H-like nuclease